MNSCTQEDLLVEDPSLLEERHISLDKMDIDEMESLAEENVLKPDQLLNHSLPITCLKLVDGVVLVASEGPSILVKMAYLEKHPFQRMQLFPNQSVISGMEFFQDEETKLTSDVSYTSYIWAGSLGRIVKMTRSMKGVLRIWNTDMDPFVNLDFIPVAAKWLEKGRILALLSVLNYLVLFERDEEIHKGSGKSAALQQIKRIKCDKSETLFSGTISGDDRHKIRIFAGTVFNGVLVWDIVNGQASTVKHELKCHDGIVFSVEYYAKRKILLSTSDDRTVAVWKFSEQADKEYAELMHRFYGHDARVWKALLIHGYVLSVGESSDVRVNILKDGKEHKTWKAHDGAPIFTCAYDSDLEILYTGGNDGSIRKWPMWWYQSKPKILGYDVITFDGKKDEKSRIQGSGRWSENKDFPKSVAFLDINHVIVSMESGRIMGLSWEGTQFDLLEDERCEGYQIIKVSPDHKILAVAGNDGHFYTAELTITENEASKRKILYAKKLFMTRISWSIVTMIWLDVSRLLIICLNRGIVIYMKPNAKGERSEVEFVQTLNLDLQRPGVPAAVDIEEKYIILGDESGSLHVFRYHKANDAIAKFENAHKDGCTSLLHHDSKLFSTGRDGKVRCFQIASSIENDLDVELIPLYSLLLPFDWVTGVYENINQLLCCGFQKEDFVLYSLKEKRTLLKIPCGGGGNRKWDFKYGHGKQGSPNASLAFVKDKEIFYTFLPMEGYLGNTLKEGLHSKTINCLVHLQSGDNKDEFISGSEDGSLKWFQWDRTNDRVRCIESMENHVSSIRCASVITTTANNKLLFTGGGRSQLCIYNLDLQNQRLELLKEIVLVKTTFKQTEGDVRIMDVVTIDRGQDEIWCFSACSDGIVRILYFSYKTNKFKIAGLLNGNAHSVMKVKIVQSTPEMVTICGVTSNGYLLVWTWNKMDLNTVTTSLIPEKSYDFQKLLRRTAFLSFNISPIDRDSNSLSVICGGDDCSISLYRLTIDNSACPRNFSIECVWTKDQIQRGAVVGVDIRDTIIYTLSNDEIIGIWDLTGNLISKKYAGVSDCQGFVVNNSSSECIACFGKGVSWVSVQL